jgi:hypothetical protein
VATTEGWTVEYLTHDWATLGTFFPLSPVVVLKLKEPSTLTCELALGDELLTQDLIGPKRTDFRLYRKDTEILTGELRKVNLSGERDTLVCDHSDYMQYLDERIYPFTYPFSFGDWPKSWVAQDLTTIAEAILEAMVDEDPYCPPYVFNNALTGTTTNYQIDAGAETMVLQHLKTLAEQDEGFDFRVKRDVNNVRFTMTSPKFDNGTSVYTITKDIGEIGEGFDWSNDGPEATWTLGLGAGTSNKSAAAISTFDASREQYRRRDAVANFGEVRNLQMLQRLTAAEGYRQRFPQKSLTLPITVNTAHLPNFWASSLGRPYTLLGRRIHVGPILFRNYHTIDADFKIIDMTIAPDESGNDFVTFGLDMIDG